LIKTPPSIPRVLAMVLFALSCICILLWLWLTFGGPIALKPKGYQAKVAFDEAVQLTTDLDVRSAGITIGSIKKSEPDPKSGRTLVTIEIDEKFAPLASDARAILRFKTLLAETFIEIAPGSKDAEPLADGGRLPLGQVQRTVELDEVFQSYDPFTRQAFRTWQHEVARAVGHRNEDPSDPDNRGDDLNRALGHFPEFEGEAIDLLDVLNRHEREVRGLVRDTGHVYGALTRDERQLHNLVVNSDRLFEQTQRERESLAEAIFIFPTFLEESRATSVRLEAFARNTKPLIEDLRPVTRELQPTVRAVRRLAPDLRRYFHVFDDQIRETLRAGPAQRQVLRATRPLLQSLGPFLEEFNPILEWLELHNHLVADFLGYGASASKDTISTAPPNEVGHYLRQLSANGIESFGSFPERTSTNRGNAYPAPMQLHPRYVQHSIFGNWDCVPSGGETMPNENPPSRPGCVLAEYTTFQGRRQDRFPHVQANNYGR
jgi:phospholipid/cholesterol/gamma-HCH transport system substrate-binding protein